MGTFEFNVEHRSSCDVFNYGIDHQPDRTSKNNVTDNGTVYYRMAFAVHRIKCYYADSWTSIYWGRMWGHLCKRTGMFMMSADLKTSDSRSAQTNFQVAFLIIERDFRFTVAKMRKSQFGELLDRSFTL